MAEEAKKEADNEQQDNDANDDNEDNDNEEEEQGDTTDTEKKDKKKKKKKKKKWDLEEHLGSVSIKIPIKFDANRGQDGLKEAGWWVNRRGKITAIDGGVPPTPNDQPETYLVQQYISFVITDEEYYNYKLIRIKADEQKRIARANIYVSPDYNTKKTVMMVIPGTGIVNAGEFATSVCKFDNIVVGSAFPFMEYAKQRDFGVVLFDPNGLTKRHGNVTDEIHCVYVFDTYIRPYLRELNQKDEQKEKTQDDEKKEQEQNKVIENLLILAHSAGGRRTTYLLKERGEIIQHYIKAVALTDIKDPKQQIWKYERSMEDGEKEKAQFAKKIYKQCSRNWVKSKNRKLDESLKKGPKGAVCQRVSSGHSEHKYTTPSAYPSIVKFFDEKMGVTDVDK